jgi:drug/metabolite transporter (DMT)-like permease
MLSIPMAGLSGLGMFFGILSGACDASGAILQKSVINKIPPAEREIRFMRRLLHSPVWLLGLSMSLVFGTICVLTAQKLVGPALVPGLNASGLVFLAIGSVKLIGEKLNRSEVVGIAVMVLGIFFLGYSNPSITGDSVSLLENGLLLRITIFSLGLGLCWVFSSTLARSALSESRGYIMATSAGISLGIMNLWLLPLILTVGLVFSGSARGMETVTFVSASIILVLTDIVAIRQVQEAYKFAPASKVQPILQIPVQITPILIYLFVYQRQVSRAGGLLIPLGVMMIILSGFLLGKRKAEVEVSEQVEIASTPDVLIP